jgi:hypothetical protein
MQPPATTTVINNYYYNDDGWDGPWWNRYRWEHYYRHRHPGLTIVIGDPYWADPWHPAYYYGHRHYDDWYWCDDYWYHPTYRGPGWVTWDPYYPYPPYPYYGCMPPSYYYDYAWSYDPYWYGGRYYGHRYDGYDSYGSAGRPNAKRGRIGGGERRASEEPTGGGHIDRTAPLGDARNTPVHVAGPDGMSSGDVRVATTPTPADPDISTADDTRIPDRQPMRANEGTRANPSTETAVTERQPQKLTPKESNDDAGAVRTPTRSRAPENAKPESGEQAPQHVLQPKHSEPRQDPAKSVYIPPSGSERSHEQAREPERSTPARDADRGEGRNESRPTRTDSGSSGDRNSSDRNSNDNTRSSGRAR